MAQNDSESFSRDVEKAQEVSHPSVPSTPTEVIKTEIDDKTGQPLGSPVQGLLVELDADEDPRNWAKWRKWLIILIVSTGATCATCGSSVVSVPAEFSTGLTYGHRFNRPPFRKLLPR